MTEPILIYVVALEAPFINWTGELSSYNLEEKYCTVIDVEEKEQLIRFSEALDVDTCEPFDFVSYDKSLKSEVNLDTKVTLTIGELQEIFVAGTNFENLQREFKTEEDCEGVKTFRTYISKRFNLNL